MAARKKKPDVRELESSANVLRGVAMHLAVIAKRSGVDLSEPSKAIHDCIDKIDAYTEARTT